MTRVLDVLGRESAERRASARARAQDRANETRASVPPRHARDVRERDARPRGHEARFRASDLWHGRRR